MAESPAHGQPAWPSTKNRIKQAFMKHMLGKDKEGDSPNQGDDHNGGTKSDERVESNEGAVDSNETAELKDEERTSFQSRDSLGFLKVGPVQCLWRRYQYQPFNPQKNEIRLLRIHQPIKSGGDKRIECSLLTTSLDAAPSYQALSYTWGSQQDTKDIILDKYRFKVSSSLNAALLQLRSNKVIFIWIDALCINQTDLMERSEQVSKMRTIYEKANEVLVWLGPGSGESSLAFKILDDIYEHRHHKEDVCKILEDETKLPHFERLNDVLSNEYWNRLWVVQEVNSARMVTILCGDRKYNWEKWKSIRNILYHDSYYRSLVSKLSIHEGLDSLDHEIFGGGPFALELPLSDSASDLPHLYTLLWKFWRQKTSDPRDKIYAIVGLSKARNDSNFVIDYSASVREVYMSAAKHIMKSSQRLDFICSMARDADEFGLPSWVPDWVFHDNRLTYPLSSMISTGSRTFRATRSSVAQFEFGSGDQSLVAKGVVLGRVRYNGKRASLTNWKDINTGIPVLLSWYSLCTAHTLAQSEAFGRIIRYGGVERADVERAENSSMAKFHRILGSIALLARVICPAEAVDPKFLDFINEYQISSWYAEGMVKAICTTIRNRRFFVSDSELLGMGPGSIEPGDMICLLLGCFVPVILRPQDGYYTFLGDAFVDGYMCGKGMDELAEGKFQLESFEIRPRPPYNYDPELENLHQGELNVDLEWESLDFAKFGLNCKNTESNSNTGYRRDLDLGAS